MTAEAVLCSESIMACMANIHSFVLMDCRQMKEFGDTSEEVAVSQSRNAKKDQDKAQPTVLPNKPYSRSIMLENIRLPVLNCLSVIHEYW
jgi:dynein heavy chain